MGLIPCVKITDSIGYSGRWFIAEVMLKERGVGIGADDIARLHVEHLHSRLMPGNILYGLYKVEEPYRFGISNIINTVWYLLVVV